MAGFIDIEQMRKSAKLRIAGTKEKDFANTKAKDFDFLAAHELKQILL